MLKSLYNVRGGTLYSRGAKPSTAKIMHTDKLIWILHILWEMKQKNLKQKIQHLYKQNCLVWRRFWKNCLHFCFILLPLRYWPKRILKISNFSIIFWIKYRFLQKIYVFLHSFTTENTGRLAHLFPC